MLNKRRSGTPLMPFAQPREDFLALRGARRPISVGRSPEVMLRDDAREAATVLPFRPFVRFGDYFDLGK